MANDKKPLFLDIDKGVFGTFKEIEGDMKSGENTIRYLGFNQPWAVNTLIGGENFDTTNYTVSEEDIHRQTYKKLPGEQGWEPEATIIVRKNGLLSQILNQEAQSRIEDLKRQNKRLREELEAAEVDLAEISSDAEVEKDQTGNRRNIRDTGW